LFLACFCCSNVLECTPEYSAEHFLFSPFPENRFISQFVDWAFSAVGIAVFTEYFGCLVDFWGFAIGAKTNDASAVATIKRGGLYALVFGLNMFNRPHFVHLARFSFCFFSL
jgi:hypothetical protein